MMIAIKENISHIQSSKIWKKNRRNRGTKSIPL